VSACGNPLDPVVLERLAKDVVIGLLLTDAGKGVLV